MVLPLGAAAGQSTGAGGRALQPVVTGAGATATGSAGADARQLAAAVQLRRAAGNPALLREDAETGATETVETGPKT